MRTTTILFVFLVFSCGCAHIPRIKVPGAQVSAPKDAGTPATLDSDTSEAHFTIPAGATLTVERVAALPARPASKTASAVAPQPAKEVRTWTFPSASPYVEHARKVLAATGTIDTSVAIHKADNAERRILLWVSIGAAVAFVLLRGFVPAWPIFSNSSAILSLLAFAGWKFSEVPSWILGAIVAVAVLGALFYKRGEWDANGNGVPDVLEKK
jgi:hypothetical protein